MKIIGLDVGEKRIGVARADSNIKIANPDRLIPVDGQEFKALARLAEQYDTKYFVLGLPRSNEGRETAQTAYVRRFASALGRAIPGVKICFQDESLTSVEAEDRLKSRRRPYAKGDIDIEAATIILQDFLDRSPAGPASNTARKVTTRLLIFTFPVLIALLAVAWYALSLRPPCSSSCPASPFTVNDGATVSQVADDLKSAGLIRSSLVFKIHYRLHDGLLKSGEYELSSALSTPEIIDRLKAGASSKNVFSFTILPGEALSSIKENLISVGYDQTAVNQAFSKNYDHPALKWKPADVSLEGYLYAETYEFFKDASVEDIILTALDHLWAVAEENQLVAGYEAHGLNFHQGLTLASIVQKEAHTPDQPTVAGVFYNRLASGIALGSDVTATYAADLLDPSRQTYTDNAAILAIDSPYNTRKHPGLPPGPISTPGLSALLAVKSPVDSDYLYFLTGDDNMMYYSRTEEEHLRNAAEHCQKLCNVTL